MVKSFQGVRQAKPKAAPVQEVHVKDYMTRQLITFHPEQTMDEVIKILLTKRISGGPVVDDEKNLVGIISEGDCLKEVVKGKYTNTPSLSGKVKDHMAINVKTMDPETNIFEAAGKFLEMKLRRFPVMKDGKPTPAENPADILGGVQPKSTEKVTFENYHELIEQVKAHAEKVDAQLIFIPSSQVVFEKIFVGNLSRQLALATQIPVYIHF